MKKSTYIDYGVLLACLSQQPSNVHASLAATIAERQHIMNRFFSTVLSDTDRAKHSLIKGSVVHFWQDNAA